MKRYVKASSKGRAAAWQDHLSESVYNRLAMCSSTKKDILELTRAFYYYSDRVKRDNMSKEDCLVYMLEWVLDWNGGLWDYTEDEYQEWLSLI